MHGRHLRDWIGVHARAAPVQCLVQRSCRAARSTDRSDPYVTPAEETLAALRRLGDETVDRLLPENEGGWESMSRADRRTAELLARTVAGRLFEMPARRLEAESAGEQEAHAVALCRLFAVSAEPHAGVRPGQASA